MEALYRMDQKTAPFSHYAKLQDSRNSSWYLILDLPLTLLIACQVIVAAYCHKFSHCSFYCQALLYFSEIGRHTNCYVTMMVIIDIYFELIIFTYFIHHILTRITRLYRDVFRKIHLYVQSFWTIVEFEFSCNEQKQDSIVLCVLDHPECPLTKSDNKCLDFPIVFL